MRVNAIRVYTRIRVQVQVYYGCALHCVYLSAEQTKCTIRLDRIREKKEKKSTPNERIKWNFYFQLLSNSFVRWLHISLYKSKVYNTTQIHNNAYTARYREKRMNCLFPIVGIPCTVVHFNFLFSIHQVL